MNAGALQRQGYSIAALRALARKRLPRMLFDMADGAAGDEITMRRNEAALAAIELAPKLLEGAPTRDQSVELFGAKLRSPVIIGPTGLAGLYGRTPSSPRPAQRRGSARSTAPATPRRRRSRKSARRPEGQNGCRCFSTRIAASPRNSPSRAAAAGYKALILTVDNQVTAGRDRDARNRMSFPLRWGPRSVFDFVSRPGWLVRMARTPSPTFVNYGKRTTISDFGPLMAEQLDPDVSWADVDRLRKQWRGPLLIKGLLHPDDAGEAIGRGADGIIVSNHGGRQLDGAVATIVALPGIVEAVGGRAPVLIDGGFRRGIDVVKALALGARAVLIGRPHLWGVACAGEDGVFWALELFRREIDRALALGGWDGVARLDASIFFPAQSDGNRGGPR